MIMLVPPCILYAFWFWGFRLEMPPPHTQPFDVAALVKLPARDDGVEEIGLILAHDARRLA